MLGVEAIGLEDQLRRFRRLVGIGDAREERELTGPRASVEPFGVSRLTHGERRGDMDLQKRRGESPDPVAAFAVRTDGRHDGDDAISLQKMRHPADSPHVRVAIFSGVAQAFAQVLAHLVAVEDLDGEASGHEPFGESSSEGALARTRKPSEPNDYAAHDSSPRMRESVRPDSQPTEAMLARESRTNYPVLSATSAGCSSRAYADINASSP